MDKNEMNTYLTQKEWEHILDVVMLSKSMKSYLTDKLDQMWGKPHICKLIYGSPVPLTKKAELLKKLSEKEKILDASTDFSETYTACFIDICDAIYSMNDTDTASVYYLKDRWWDPDFHDEQQSGVAPFASFQMAENYIRSEMEDGEDDNCWYEIEKWKPDSSAQKYLHEYTYYIIEGDVVWFDRRSGDETFRSCCFMKHTGNYFSKPNYLNLPVPFRPGDIVTLDCKPFIPRKTALILETGNNRDKCSLWALAISEQDDEWTFGAVKTSSIFDFRSIHLEMFSPLYRIEKYDGNLNGREMVFKTLSEYIDGSEERGTEVWKWERMFGVFDNI